MFFALIQQFSILLIGVLIQLTYGVNPGEPGSLHDNVASSSGKSDASPTEEIAEKLELADMFVSNWNDMNRAIDAFVQEYELQHGITVQPAREMQSLMSFNSICGLFQLKFSFQQDGQKFQSSVIVKVPEVGQKYLKGERMLLHKKEKYVYEHVLPRLFVVGGEKLWPNFYASTDSGTLIIENLQESGFDSFSGSEIRLMDQAECTRVLRTLAQFHAWSTSPHLDHVHADLNSSTIYKKRTGGIRNERIFQLLLEKFRKNVLPSLAEDVAKEFENMVQIVDTIIDESIYDVQKNVLNVIVHGNPNPTTILLRKDNEKKVIECKLIDFLNTRRGSPAIDVINFLLTSAQFEVVEKHLDTLLQLYVDELSRVLETMGDTNSKRYSLHELRVDLRKHKAYFIYRMVFGVLPLWANYRYIQSDECMYDKLFRSLKYIFYFNHWMVILDS